MNRYEALVKELAAAKALLHVITKGVGQDPHLHLLMLTPSVQRAQEELDDAITVRQAVEDVYRHQTSQLRIAFSQPELPLTPAHLDTYRRTRHEQ